MDYKPLYYRLFHAITKALGALERPSGVKSAQRILKQAQRDSEAAFIARPDTDEVPKPASDGSFHG